MRYNRKQVEQMVAETEESISLLLKNEASARQAAEVQPAAQPLKKNDAPPPPEPKEDASASPPDASASPDAPPMDAGSDSSSAAAPPMDASASAGGLPTVEELKAEYAQLSPEEFQVHAQAMAAVLAEKQGAAAGGQPPAAAPQPAAPPPTGAGNATLPGEGSQGTDPAMAMKSEQLEAEVKDLKKSLDEQKVANADLKKSVESVAQILQKAFAPKQKAVTAMDAIPTSVEPAKPLTKAEINQKISALDKDTLKKSDFQAIKDFYNGKVPVTSIAHLLK